MAEEQTSEWPVKLGTKYQNRGASGDWSKYTVTKFKENQLFELSEVNGSYHVEYIFTPKGSNATELCYTEWVETGEPENPLSMEALNKLKELIEGL
jgi:hypothetical protein